MLTVLEDTTAGAHDTLISACDSWRYRELGVVGPDDHHDNCADNMVQALRDLGKYRTVLNRHAKCMEIEASPLIPSRDSCL